MMKFRTEIKIRPEDWEINHSDQLFLAGSCFSESIGEMLCMNKFKATINPFGIAYNPLSIFKLCEASLLNTVEKLQPVFESNGTWKSFDLHSSFSETEKNSAIININDAINVSHHAINSAKVIFLTFGTAHAFMHLQSGEIVSNCHKMPEELFAQKILSMGEMKESANSFLQKLFEAKPDVKVVLTVSPVRHTRFGLAKNFSGKAALKILCDELCNEYKQVSYFPSYEIMMDDLRDYRFYKADLIHPNDQAIEYIWEKFAAKYFSDTTNSLCSRWKKIRSEINHKSFHPGSDEDRKFKQKVLENLKGISAELDVSTEIGLINSELR